MSEPDLGQCACQSEARTGAHVECGVIEHLNGAHDARGGLIGRLVTQQVGGFLIDAYGGDRTLLIGKLGQVLADRRGLRAGIGGGVAHLKNQAGVGIGRRLAGRKRIGQRRGEIGDVAVAARRSVELMRSARDW
jgi:hypothetical protein